VSRYDEPLALLRAASRPDRPVPERMGAYAQKVRTEAYRITDDDLTALQEAGFSEDEIFEQTVSLAVAAGLERFRAGTAALP
jgi:hypothetical protein